MRVRPLIAAAAAGALTLSSCSSTRPQGQRDRVADVKVKDRTLGTSELRPGITHTHITVATGPPADALKQLLIGKTLYQNQHIMGWGANNPQPSPGVFDWESLDERINLIRETAGIPVLTLCCSPDWMKGGEPGKTDWDRLNEAPLPEHYRDFAALAGEVAKRYPDVKHYQVWHGMKGFYDRKSRRWDHQGYTELYNLVYRELKSIDPGIKVGGPYVNMTSWSAPARASHPSKVSGPWGVLDQRDLDAVDHWLKNKEGADFVTLDMSTHPKDRVSKADPAAATDKISAIARWLRKRTDLPVWAARWHLFPPNRTELGLLEQSTVLAAGITRMLESGIDVELLWAPQSRGHNCSGCLWGDLRLSGGGGPTPAMTALESIFALFPPGTPLLDTSVSKSTVSAISSPVATVLINHSSRTQDVRLNGRGHRLDPFEVRAFPRPPPSAT